MVTLSFAVEKTAPVATGLVATAPAAVVTDDRGVQRRYR